MLPRTHVRRNGYRPKPVEGEEGSGDPISWDDLPLLKYELEVFVQVGAWKNIEEMEESLLLHELFIMYRACGNEYTKTIKASAVAFGGEVDFDEDWYDPAPPPPKPIIDGSNVGQLPIGLGYAME